MVIAVCTRSNMLSISWLGSSWTPSSTTIWSYLDKNGLLTCGIKMSVLEFFSVAQSVYIFFDLCFPRLTCGIKNSVYIFFDTTQIKVVFLFTLTCNWQLKLFFKCYITYTSLSICVRQSLKNVIIYSEWKSILSSILVDPMDFGKLHYVSRSYFI